MNTQHTEQIREIFIQNRLPAPTKITPFESGQINFVYDIDNTYVIKIEGKETFATGIFKHQGSLMEQLSTLGVSVPKVIAVGDEPVKYLLLEKIPGTNLINDWENFSKKEKESLFIQIAKELRGIHSLKANIFSPLTYTGLTFSTLGEAMDEHFNSFELERVNLKPKFKAALEFLEKYYRDNRSALDDPELKPACIHGDFHFGNIFHKDSRITGIIDWDWSGQMPKEYELYNILGFYIQPAKYVEEKLEKEYREKLKQEIQWLREFYPELFVHPNLLQLIRLFFIPGFKDDFYWHEKGRWNDGVMEDVLKRIEFIYGKGLEDFIYGKL